MFLSYLRVIVPIIGLMINVLVQIVSFRYISSLSLLKSEFLGFAIGLSSVFMLEFYAFFTLSTSAKDFIFILITNLLTYSLLGYCYFHFINLGETARRIRILRELVDSEKGLSMNEILSRYNAKEIVERRINRLIRNGQIIYKDNRYYIAKPLVLWIARIITTLKLVILGRRSEFD